MDSSTDLVGGYDVVLVSVMPKKYVCPFCNLLMRDAIQTYRGEMACESCFLKAKGDSQICPIDNEPFDDDEIADHWFRDKHARRQILQLKCYCINQDNGCNWNGTIHDLDQHRQTCAHSAYEIMSANEQELQKLNVRIDQLERRSAVLSANLSELELKLQLFENTCYDGQQLWKVDNVTQRINQAKTGKVSALHSVPCFTKRGGYKFCAILYLNGDGMGGGTHVPLIFLINKGEYDALLQWPFSQHVTFHHINPHYAAGCPMFMRRESLPRILNIKLYHKIIINTYIYYYKLLSQIIITNLRYFEMVHFISYIACSVYSSSAFEKQQTLMPKDDFECEDKAFKCETFILNHIPSNPSISIPVELLLWNLSDLTWFLGKGSFGDVYGYKDKNINCCVAIKKISIPTNGVMKEANDVRKEVEMHMKLKHENIVQYVGSYEINNNLFIVLEYMDKGSLRSKLNELKLSQALVTNQPVLPYDEILKYTHEIVAGLVYLHSNKVIHRDLRSANVLLSAAGTAKIADFGIYKDLSRLCIHSGFSSMVDNAHWCSPELIMQEKEKICCKVDVWSLGVTILEMIHVVPPFIERSFEHVAYMFALCVRKELPDIPHFVREDIKAILQQCLVFEADERPYSKNLLD